LEGELERSFSKEVELLRLGEGEVFHGEGILAVAKGLLQAGVSYVGGYQGSPIAALLDVMVDARPVLDELGVHFEACTTESSAAAMLAASINYPLRGAVTWKAIVGTNVASDPLSYLSSSGVMGGALIIVGEDYGEGASSPQERSHAFAMKSSMWLLDPRPNLTRIADLTELAFELSEASNTPVMMELRIRTCHVTGSFKTRDNKAPEYSSKNPIEPAKFDRERLSIPPFVHGQEKKKFDERFGAAINFIRDNKVNEIFDGPMKDVGIVVQGGLYNTLVNALERVGLCDICGESQIPIYVLNATYPLIDDEVADFCRDKRHVLMVEESHPAYLEQAFNAILRKAKVDAEIIGKDVLPMTGEYSLEVMISGVVKFLEGAVPKGADLAKASQTAAAIIDHKSASTAALGSPIPPRPATFCVGCPERPVFSAMKLMQREIGEIHVSADIGCHTMGAGAPFGFGNSVLGYGMGLGSSAAVVPTQGKRVISVMGDGGFWHSGLTSGVAGAVFNESDSVLLIMKNGYSSATGQQTLPSSALNPFGEFVDMSIEKAVKGLGVKWLRTIRTYSVATMVKTLREAMTTKEKGLKVIVAEGECQLAKQRRVRRAARIILERGGRYVRTRFGVDSATCTGDHSCIRLSGCPSLTVKDNPNPLKEDPVAYVNNGCVGCGLCGEVSHAAILCPSFYRAEIVKNPILPERILAWVRRTVIGMLQSSETSPLNPAAQ
jgi:indolepyruvate ferredoxin oxidoreductase alpha subunit